MPPLDEAYFVWLYSQVGEVNNKNLSMTYWKLLKLLYEKEFTWSEIEMDGNRAQDGKDLRIEFLRETRMRKGNDPAWMDMPCSVLEMLVAMSCKLAFQGGYDCAYWFWMMIDNLGLNLCTDANELVEPVIDQILERMINRQYEPDGAGGLFPLQSTHQDQRDVDLWYQAEAYLLERL